MEASKYKKEVFFFLEPSPLTTVKWHYLPN